VADVGQTDSDLVTRCQQGEQKCFNQLVLKYEDRVFNLVYRMVGNHEDACDIAQEVFVRAYNGLGGFKGQSSFYTWLYRITFNTVTSFRRAAAVRPDHRAPARINENPAHGIEPVAAGVDPSDTASAREEHRLVHEAIQSLDEAHRVVLLLRDIEGQGYDEIARILNCPRGTVKSRVHRARQALKGALVLVLGQDWLKAGGHGEQQRTPS